MLQLFSNSYTRRGQISHAPTLASVRSRVAMSVEQIKAWSAKNALAVFADHPLAQALKLISVTAHADAQSIYEKAYARSPYIAKSLKFTSEVNQGTTLQGRHDLYKGCDNLVISISDYVSPTQALLDWQTLEPVKCLWVETNSLNMNSAQTPGFFQPFTVLSVDLPLLAVMFLGFLKYRSRVMENVTESLVLGEENFIAMYVMPAILRSQVDISAFSTTEAIFRGTYKHNFRAQYPIYVPTYDQDFVKVASYALARITDTRMQYVHMLQHLPAIFKEDAGQALQLPDVAPTSQVGWALLVSRMKAIDFLLDVGGGDGRRANMGYIGELQKKVRQIRSVGVPYNAMSDAQANYVDAALLRYLKL